jgi:hypothetical protein
MQEEKHKFIYNKWDRETYYSNATFRGAPWHHAWKSTVINLAVSDDHTVLTLYKSTETTNIATGGTVRKPYIKRL